MPFLNRAGARRRATRTGGVTSRSRHSRPEQWVPRPLLTGYGSVLDLTGGAGLHQILRRYSQESVAEALCQDWTLVGNDCERALVRLYGDLDPGAAARLPDPRQLMLPLGDRGSAWFIAHVDDRPDQAGPPAAGSLPS